jgi:hypothetical protein
MNVLHQKVVIFGFSLDSLVTLRVLVLQVIKHAMELS